MIECSVVIPCRNGGPWLARQLDALAAKQDFTGSYEVIVADNGSSDGSVAVVLKYATQYPNVRSVDASDGLGINHGRNVGVRASRGKYVLLCDADDEASPSWISAMTAALQDGAACVGGVVERCLRSGASLGRDSGLYEVYWDVPWPIGANCGFERGVFDKIGGFDESFIGGGDETDFFWRAHLAGYATLAVPEAVMVYYVRDRFRDVARQNFAYGRGAVRLYVKFRPWGMPRSPLWRFPAALFWGVARLIGSPPHSVARRRAVADLAGRAGRVWESMRSQVLYL